MSGYPPFDKRYPEIPSLNTFFESLLDSNIIYIDTFLSAWAKPLTNTTDSGNVNMSDGGANLSTGTTSGSVAVVKLHEDFTYTLEPKPTFDRKRMFRAKVRLVNDTEQEVYIKSGRRGANPHFGFYVVDNTLKMSVADGDTQNTSDIETFTATKDYVLKAVLYPADRVEFYVNGENVGRLSSNLPTGTTRASKFAGVWLTNTEAADKTVRWTFIRFLQMEP